MAWGKVDDKLHASVKWRRASKGARALWTTALSWCCDQENDGEIPKDMLRVLDGTPAEAKSLVNAGLWNEKENGWSFHNWTKYNPDSASIRAKREAESEGGKRGNHTRWHVKQGLTVPDCEFCQEGLPDSGGGRVPDQGGESGANPPVPSRPVPSRTQVPTPNGVGRARARNHALPDNWEPTPEHHERATETGLDLDREVIKFRAHAEEKGRLAKNWNAAFTRWLINAAEYAKRDAQRANSGYQTQDQIMQAMWDTPATPTPLRAIEGGNR